MTGFERLRLRYQVLLTWLMSVVLPSTVAAVVWRIDPLTREQFAINCGLTVALLGGILGYRRFDDFPGTRSIGSIIPSFAASYSAVILIFFFLRLDYSGWQIVASFVLGVVFFAGLQIYIGRHYRLVLAIVPGGRAEQMIQGVDRVDWRLLMRPELPPQSINGVVADLHYDFPADWERMIADCALAGTPVFHVKEAVERLSGRVDIEHLSENMLGSLNPDRTYIKFKAVLDWIAAALMLVILWPMLLLVALLIRLESPGPALFRQQRMGFRGVPFRVYKFRTMRQPDSAESAATRTASMTLDGDPRITRLGRLLRKSRIDELPQLLNILRGEMSWIGPRPEAIPLTRWYEEQLPFYHYRHILKPGITGWAQVSQGHVVEIDDVREKLRYDFYYVKNFSPWLDMLITLKTVGTIFTGHGAR